MTYVDGFVIPVPKDKLDAYTEIAQRAKAIWMDHGALSYMESVADDVKKSATTDYFQSVKCEENETIVFSFITYKSREHRDEVNRKVMADPS